MPSTARDSVTALLLEARSEAVQPDAPALRDLAHAYAVQREVALASGWPYERALHWKSGGPNPDALQTHAPLPPAGVRSSPADLRDIAFNVRAIEIEVALRLGQDVDAKTAATLTPQSAASLIDAMCVSIEVVDSRWADGLSAPALPKLADLQAHGALVLGDWVPWQDRDWSSQHCALKIADGEWLNYTGTHPLLSPQAVLPKWLAHLTAMTDRVVAGTVVTTGSWCGMVLAKAGDSVEARFDDIGAARLQF